MLLLIQIKGMCHISEYPAASVREKFRITTQKLKAERTIIPQRFWNPVGMPAKSSIQIVHGMERIACYARTPLRIFRLVDVFHIGAKISTHLGASPLPKLLQYISQPFFHFVLRLRHRFRKSIHKLSVLFGIIRLCKITVTFPANLCRQFVNVIYFGANIARQILICLYVGFRMVVKIQMCKFKLIRNFAYRDSAEFTHIRKIDFAFLLD